MIEINFKKCNGCPYYYGEINQCMYGEEDVPDDLEKKCWEGERERSINNYINTM